ncbi:hypothetical protein NPIL_695171 [Nephila pilipes]|uniref:Uncharacterized protein n=1 Tax=Nephila pilipes TaxID=299642 RepID=A0A8X6TC62_NEPPI|nr:hypothetical protein NPIL_695171 [Nephila pilipes]
MRSRLARQISCAKLIKDYSFSELNINPHIREWTFNPEILYPSSRRIDYRRSPHGVGISLISRSIWFCLSCDFEDIYSISIDGGQIIEMIESKFISKIF